ncbi:MAG TPA: hypothetical protein VNO55_16850, partial [Polyangia bacterium]|nr:hypothetical protein [Polyangia bacterium]
LRFALPLVAAAALAARPGPAVGGAAVSPVFTVQIAADADDAAALQTVLRDAIGRQPVQLSMTLVGRIDPGALMRAPMAAPPPAVGRAYVDLTDPQHATLYVVDGPWQRILVRSVPFTSNPDIMRETVGRIVSTAVEALLAGSFERQSEAVASFETPVPVPPPPPAPRPPLLAPSLGAGYETSLYAGAHPLVQGPTLAGALVIGQRRWRPAIWLAGLYRLPLQDDGVPVGYRLSTVGLRLLAGVERTVATGWRLQLAVGGGLDLVHLQPQRNSADPAVFVTSDRWFSTGVGRVVVGLRRRLGRYLSVQGQLQIDLDASRTRLLVTDDQQTRQSLQLYPVRPGLGLALLTP